MTFTRKQKAGSQAFARAGWLPGDPRYRRNAGAQQTVYRKAKYASPLDGSVQAASSDADRFAAIEAKINAIISALVDAELMDGAP